MKKFLAITALILALLMVTLAGCGDPYSGNYKEPTEEQAQELSAKLDALIANEGKIDTKTVGEANRKWEGGSYKVKFTNVCNYSENGELISYVKLEMEYEEKILNNVELTTIKHSIELSAEAWYDEKSGKLFAEYDYKGVYDGNVDPNNSGYAKGMVDNVKIDDVDVFYDLNILPSEIFPVPYKWEVDGNKIRVRLPNAASVNDWTQYIIIESDSEFKVKGEARLSRYEEKGQTQRYEAFEGPIVSTIETVSTNDKVSLPNEQKYSGTVNLQEVTSTIRWIYRYFN